MEKKVGTDSKMADEALRYLFGADEDYIRSYYGVVEEKYGSFESYIKEGLGLTTQDITYMRTLYLEKPML